MDESLASTKWVRVSDVLMTLQLWELLTLASDSVLIREKTVNWWVAVQDGSEWDVCVLVLV